MARPEAEPKTPLAARLRDVRRALGDVERDTFAESLGVSKTTIASYERGETTPDADVIASYVESYKISPEWLLLGTGSMFKSDNVLHVSSKNRPEFVDLPVFDVRASAGGGLPVYQEVQTGIMSFEYRWLRDLGVNPETAGLIYAQGDSMYPTIQDGAAMVVDHSQKEIQNGYIYAFNIDGDLVVKRIERLFDKTINLISDNPRYPTRNLRPKQLSSLDVIGRVFYVGQRV
jgi:phage repressor protein C with HTH and peptisase S24 domain